VGTVQVMVLAAASRAEVFLRQVIESRWRRLPRLCAGVCYLL